MRNTTATSILGIMLMLAAGGVFAQDVNLARGKPCKVFSSLETSNWGTARLTDGQTGEDGWSSRAFATHADHCLYPEWATVDLGANCAIQRVVLHATDKGQGFPEDFTHPGVPRRRAVASCRRAARSTTPGRSPDV